MLEEALKVMDDLKSQARIQYNRRIEYTHIGPDGKPITVRKRAAIVNDYFAVVCYRHGGWRRWFVLHIPSSYVIAGPTRNREYAFYQAVLLSLWPAPWDSGDPDQIREYALSHRIELASRDFYWPVQMRDFWVSVGSEDWVGALRYLMAIRILDESGKPTNKQ